MKTLYEIKLRKGRIDAERKANGLPPAYASYEKEAVSCKWNWMNGKCRYVCGKNCGGK